MTQIWRYPVKSMGGEPVDHAMVGSLGLRGDRVLAVVDRETETVASAKHPRKWRRLLHCHARIASEPTSDTDLPEVMITFPDGVEGSHRDAATEDRLSELLGARVGLVARSERAWGRETDRTPPEAATHGEVIRVETMGLGSPSGTFFDYGPLHVITTATLEELRPERRPTGSDRLLDLAADRSVLRTIAELNTVESRTLAPGTPMPAVAGVYAQATAEGALTVGDPVRLLPEATPE